MNKRIVQSKQQGTVRVDFTVEDIFKCLFARFYNHFSTSYMEVNGVRFVNWSKSEFFGNFLFKNRFYTFFSTTLEIFLQIIKSSITTLISFINKVDIKVTTNSNGVPAVLAPRLIQSPA